MGSIYNVDASCGLTLRPYRLQEKEEPWVSAHLLFYKNGSVFETTGEFLLLDEIRKLIYDMKSVLEGLAAGAALATLEPDLSLSVHRVGPDQVCVQAKFLKNVSTGEVAAPTPMAFTTSYDSLRQFVWELSNEIHLISQISG